MDCLLTPAREGALLLAETQRPARAWRALQGEEGGIAGPDRRPCLGGWRWLPGRGLPLGELGRGWAPPMTRSQPPQLRVQWTCLVGQHSVVLHGLSSVFSLSFHTEKLI